MHYVDDLFSMEVKHGHMLDSTMHIQRHRVGARGNATTFLLPWEGILSELQRLEDEARSHGTGPDLPRTGQELQYVVQVLLKTNDEVTNPDRVRMRRMSRDLIVTKVFEGILEDREHVLAAYRRNIREVTMGIPKDRLLIFDVAQGWAPLCEFLGVATPDTPFPRTNNTQEFQERLTNRLATEANANKQA